MRPQPQTELNCTELDVALERRWDGELTVAQSEALEHHLSECRECAAKAVVHQRLGSALKSAEECYTRPLPSGAEWSRRVAAQERGFRQGRRALGFGGLSLAAAALAIGLFLRGDFTANGLQPQSTATIKAAAAPTPLPALLVIDDEESGRQVFQSASRTE